MRYSIGDVSRVLGMTASALHYYEKEGVIHTPKEDSGWRSYAKEDVHRLISVKKYRAMGVSLRDIAQQFSREGMAAEAIIDRMKEKRDEAQQLSRHYAALGEDIDELIRFSEEGLHREGVVDIRPAEDMLIFRSQEGGIIPRNKKDQEQARRWLEAQPAVSVSVVADPVSGKADFALAIDKKRAHDFGIEAKGGCVCEIKGGMALHATVACEEEYYQSPGDMFKPVEQFAREHRFAPKGMLCGRILFVDCAGGRQRHYYDTYMVFE